ncbi:hypothetical protein DSO57_1022176 [Entomophthora muscae]|uniref:Uncharacterized protein n=1 Tax=Entomophthora muscae TaxID=34485 RepID=A0ACC2RU88_9FUNG|nr:hypothetical protein DSO57_1022176 [Entomophthora muscae]
MAQYAYNRKNHASTGIYIFKANYGIDPTWDPSIVNKETNLSGRAWIEQIHNTQTVCLANLNQAVQTVREFFADYNNTPFNMLRLPDANKVSDTQAT